MPNYCYYQMCVKGSKKNVDEFIKVINAHYDYGTMEFSHDRHFFRVFEANCDEIEEVDDDVYKAYISGDCAWSVSTCMLENGYYKDVKERYPKYFRGTTLPIESQRLNLAIEVYSEECGMCFSEHYQIVNGEMLIDECVDYEEYYIGDYNSRLDAEEDLGIEITKEEWNSGEEYIKRGGFEEWYFDI